MSKANQVVAIALARQISLGLSNLELKERLREEAIRDPLTGLFNRRYLIEALDHELERCRRRKSMMGLIAFDLDNFKAVNDSLGHDQGDAMLKGISSLALETLRTEDILCRQGGDEFLAILPDISGPDCRGLAERLRGKVADFTRTNYPQLNEKVTLSAGLALFPEDGATAHVLLKSADQALYWAKEAGRDCIVPVSETQSQSRAS